VHGTSFEHEDFTEHHALDESSTPVAYSEAVAVTRRSFLVKGAAAIGAMTAAAELEKAQPRPNVDAITSASKRFADTSSFFDLRRVPDRVTAYGSFQKKLPANMVLLESSGVTGMLSSQPGWNPTPLF
jgi:hypothetical protein